MISVVVLTFNEATNIRRCLQSVAWSDDVLVVDSGSTDETVAIAESMGARVLVRPFDHFAGQRNFALDCGELRHEWVLHVDADEVVTQELADEIDEVVRRGPESDGYRIAGRIQFLGQWLRHAGMYPAYQVRFGHRDRLRFVMVGHGQREALVPDRVGTLRHDFIHHNFSKGVSDWVGKHARYARDEACLALEHSSSARWSDVLRAKGSVERRRVFKALAARLPMRPLVRFVYVYLFRGGVLDGRAGLRYALLIAFYQWLIDLNVLEQRQQARGE